MVLSDRPTLDGTEFPTCQQQSLGTREPFALLLDFVYA